MAEIKIGHIKLNIDPDSISYVDIKNNLVMGSSRNGPPNVIPSGSSNIAIKMGIVFTDPDDVNENLRGLIALKRGLPLLSVKSEFVSACYFAALSIDPASIKGDIKSNQEIVADRVKNRYTSLALLLTNALVSTILDQRVISIVKREFATSAIYKYLIESPLGDPRVNKYIGGKGASSSAKAFMSDLTKFYEVIINAYFQSDRLRTNKADEVDFKNATESSIITQFLRLGTDHVEDSVNGVSREIDHVITGITGASIQIEDLDTITTTTPARTYRTVGMDAYETTKPDLAGQEWYDKGATTFKLSAAQRYNSQWEDVGTVDSLVYGTDFFGRSLAEFKVSAVGAASINIGDVVNIEFVKRGYLFPMSISSFSDVSPSDNVYLQAAKDAMGSNLEIWNNASVNPLFYNAGHSIPKDRSDMSVALDVSSKKTVLPSDFRKVGRKGTHPIYTIPLADLSAITIGEVTQFTVSFQDPSGAVIPIQIRAITDGSGFTSYKQFINDYYYFMTLGRSTRSLVDFGLITHDKDGFINESTNKNPYYINAVISGPDFKDAATGLGSGTQTHLHLFLAFSEVSAYVKSAGLSISRIKYKKLPGGTFEDLQSSDSLHVDSRLVTAASITMDEVRGRVTRGINVAKISSNDWGSSRTGLSKIQRAFQDLIDSDAENNALSSQTDAENSNKLIAGQFPGGWVPLAFSNIEISTIPNQPHSLYASLTFLPFDYSPFAPVFGYIPTFFDLENRGSIRALDQIHGKYELDLSKTPVVTNWLTKEYLVDKYANEDFVGTYNPLTGSDTPDLIINYQYPEALFTDPKKLKAQGTVRIDKNVTLNIFSRERIKSGPNTDIDVDGITSVYGMKVVSIHGGESSSIKTISLQASAIPTIQNMGRGSVSFRVVFETNSLESIAQIRLIDSAMNVVSRSTYHEFVPVKMEMVGPVVSMFGKRSYVPSDFIISEVPGKSGWYSVTMDVSETNRSFKSESLTKDTEFDVRSIDSRDQDRILDLVADKLSYYSDKKDDQHLNVVSDTLWKMLVGGHRKLVKGSDQIALESIPITLFGVGVSAFDEIAYSIGEKPGPKKNGATDSRVLSVKAYIQGIAKKVRYGRERIAYNQYSSANFKPIRTLLAESYDDQKSIDKLRSLFIQLEMSPVIMGDETLDLLYKARKYTFPNTRISSYGQVVIEGKSDVTYGVYPFVPAVLNIDGLLARRDNQRRNHGWRSSERLIQLLSKKYGLMKESYDSIKSNAAYTDFGLWGEFIDSGNMDAAINDRLKISRTENYSYVDEDIEEPPGLSHMHNYCASVMSVLSFRLHELKTSNAVSSPNNIDPQTKTFVSGLLAVASQSSVFMRHLRFVMKSLSLQDSDIRDSIKSIPRTQSGMKDLSLPTYSDIYGVNTYKNSKSQDIFNLLSSCYAICNRVPVQPFRSISLSLYKILLYPNKEALDSLLESRSTAINISKKAISKTTQLIDIAVLNVDDNDTRIAKVFRNSLNALVDLEEALLLITSRDYSSKISVDPSNLPTYSHLAIPARVSSANGAPDIHAPARLDSEKMESGWQYFSVFNFKPEDIRDYNYRLETRLSGTRVNLTDDAAKNGRDASINRRLDTTASRSDSFKSSINDPDNIDQHLAENSRVKTINFESEEFINKHFTDDSNSHSTTNIIPSKQELQRIKNNNTNRKKGVSVETGKDKANYSKFRSNEIHPIHGNYSAVMHKVRENFKPSNLFDFRRMTPVVHVYFSQEVASYTDLFENWHDSYRYDSVTYVAVTRAKNMVDTAVLRMSNITGLLTNKLDIARADLNESDVIRTNNITVSRTPSSSIRQRGDGTFSNNAVDSHGDVLAFKLEPGVRIQIRQGFSSIDRQNPIVFTGKVAEVRPGKMVEIIAQGHGRELARHVEKSWSGSYDSFPSIITSLLQGTESLGGWEPYIYQGSMYESYRNKFPDDIYRERLKIGLEKRPSYDRINDTSNDNLWGLKDEGKMDSIWNILQYVDGGKWYCNGSALENIQSMQRYLPNYIVDVRPYDNRGTLFFGPRDGLYIYTSELQDEQAKYLKASKTIDNATKGLGIIDGLFYSNSNLVFGNENSQVYKDMSKTGSFNDVMKSGKNVVPWLFSINKRTIPKTDFSSIGYIDMSRANFYFFHSMMNGDLVAAASIDSRFGKEKYRSGFMDPRRAQSDYEVVTPASKKVDRWGRPSPEFKQQAALAKSNANAVGRDFTTAYALSDIVDDEFGRYVNPFKTAANLRYDFMLDNGEGILDYGSIGSCDYYLFQDLIFAEYGDIPKEFFKGFENLGGTKKQLSSYEIGYNLKRILQTYSPKDKKTKNGKMIRTIKFGLNKELRKLIDTPIFYYAIPSPDGKKLGWAGYFTYGDLIIGDSKIATWFSNYYLPTMRLGAYVMSFKVNSNEDIAVTSNIRVPYPVAPNRKPFRIHHSVFDNSIVSNDIIATKANMANNVTLWYPDSGNANEPKDLIDASDMKYSRASYAPVLTEELAVSVFDRNCESSSYSGDRTTQVTFAHLGEFLREMYQGSLTILGESTINPHDVIALRDTTKDMNGNFEVKTVTHIYDVNIGFLTVITPHLMVSVNEDTESMAVFQDSLIESSLKLLSGVAIVGFALLGGLATVTTGGLFLLVAGVALYAGASYLQSERGVSGDAASSFLGIELPHFTTVGYSSYITSGGEHSVRRNPCRIDPLTYKGAPLVAGLDGWSKRNWTNKEARIISARYREIGRKLLIKSIGDFVTITVFGEDDLDKLKRSQVEAARKLSNN